MTGRPGQLHTKQLIEPHQGDLQQPQHQGLRHNGTMKIHHLEQEEEEEELQLEHNTF
ncbi:hypothetical protein M378DRAFT_17975 [Amanita muscaria Koide BX008]|uniref:Uncharacterized protein n=1 Tax=Amanita muscaria (strain Koide BX008) TaxID=946122 RepID=A0A0C2WH20_AMAMK|nr:hypothetical protein M378DRAFT_17975 [Amanita muscaria Koide BX008]